MRAGAKVACRRPCSSTQGEPVCRECERLESEWGEAMAALIDDGDEPRAVVGPGELAHVRGELA